MDRICHSLAVGGYAVTLIGRRLPASVPLSVKRYSQKRLPCFFNQGRLFYAEYNLRLFFFLLFKRMDAICSVDLDTILAGLFLSRMKKVPRVYDAHELFCEMKEVVTRRGVYRVWKRIEKFAVPKFAEGYTVSRPIAGQFREMYAVDYELIRNMPVFENTALPEKKEKYILYQGAVNEGRSFETLIPAIRDVDAKLIICGDGNFMRQAKNIVAVHDLGERVIFTGMLSPVELRHYTLHAAIGITLFENKGLSNYYSLANRFFDYMHACIPQLCVDYPAYREINERFRVAVLLNDLSSEAIAESLNNLLDNDVLYQEIQQACSKARQIYNWQEEEKKLLAFYSRVFS
jgi:glycosyltransferase involved in cell wall biosynthesis